MKSICSVTRNQSAVPGSVSVQKAYSRCFVTYRATAMRSSCARVASSMASIMMRSTMSGSVHFLCVVFLMLKFLFL